MPMDFFDHQTRARRRTGLLVLLFALAVVLITAALYAVAIMAFAYADPNPAQPGPAVVSFSWWNPRLLVYVAAGTLLIVTGGTAYKVLELSGGGAAVARMLGGRPVSPGTGDRQERRLLNIVEEMAIASGLPVPAVYVLDEEEGINAFAAGFSPRDAVVAVTRGTLGILNRDELQGVVAHEFSHILNGDMRLNLRLVGILHGILLIGLTGLTIMRSLQYVRVRSRKGGGGIALIVAAGLALTVIGYIGLFFGQLIKSAIARQREYLADASAVQFTRNPSGIAGALKKIGGFYQQGRLVTSRAAEASHLYFANALSEALFGWMATHPPLIDRIRAIEPGFDGQFTEVSAGEAEAEAPARRPATAGQAAFAPSDRIAVAPEEIVRRVGTLTPEHVSYGAALIASIPEPLVEAARDAAGARALVYALLLDEEPAVRERQRAAVERDVEAARRLPAMEPLMADLGPRSRLPLVDLALPALRRLPAEATTRLIGIVRDLAAADDRLSLFEFAIQKILRRHLEWGRGAAPSAARYYAIAPLADDAEVLLSALAHAGQPDPAQALETFAVGVRRLGLKRPPSFRRREACAFEALDRALDRLADASPGVKRLVLRAASETVAFDGSVTRDEAELLRAVADTLDCPMPPFLNAE